MVFFYLIDTIEFYGICGIFVLWLFLNILDACYLVVPVGVKKYDELFASILITGRNRPG